MRTDLYDYIIIKVRYFNLNFTTRDKIDEQNVELSTCVTTVGYTTAEH